MVALLVALGFVLQVLASVIGIIAPWIIGGAVLALIIMLGIRRSWP
jgi:hypothetical protein